MNKLITVEVAYALPERQCILTIQMKSDSTIQMAIEQSGILAEFPDINLSAQSVGVFGKKKRLTDIIFDGDRIEIYRALTIDPKEARRQKAIRTKKK